MHPLVDLGHIMSDSQDRCLNYLHDEFKHVSQTTFVTIGEVLVIAMEASGLTRTNTWLLTYVAYTKTMI